MARLGLDSAPMAVNDEIESLVEVVANYEFWNVNPIWIEIASYLPYTTVKKGLGRLHELEGLDVYVGVLQKSKRIQQLFLEMPILKPKRYKDEQALALMEALPTTQHSIAYTNLPLDQIVVWGFRWLEQRQFHTEYEFKMFLRFARIDPVEIVKEITEAEKRYIFSAVSKDRKLHVSFHSTISTPYKIWNIEFVGASNRVNALTRWVNVHCTPGF